MIKVSDVVYQILLADGFAIETIQRGWLNMRAYARDIQREVEAKAKKSVSVGTIVVSLLRIKKKLVDQLDFAPQVLFSNLSITSNLAEVTYDKTKAVEEDLHRLYTGLLSKKDFFTVTEGLHEVTLICEYSQLAVIKQNFRQVCKIEIDHLVGISVRIPESYIEVPNTIYSLLGALAVRQINVMEIVSTYTELTFVIFEQDLEEAVQALRFYSQKQR